MQQLLTCAAVSLAPLFPNQLLLGLEIRDRAVQFVNERIQALRTQHTHYMSLGSTDEERDMRFRASQTPRNPEPRIEGDPRFHYLNAHAMRCNAMKYFPCYFRKGQVRQQ